MKRWVWFPSPWTRARIALLMLGCVALERASGTRVREQGLPGLSEALGRDAHAQVAPASLRWLPSGGVVWDALWGRSVMYVAAPDGAAGDVFLSRVRVAPSGRALFVAATHNLTSTPLGDDGQLVVAGHRAAFRTQAYGQVQSVTLMDVGTEGELNLCVGRVAKFLCSLNNLQHTGIWSGIGRYEAQLKTPAREVGLAVSPAALQLWIRGDGADSSTQLAWSRAPEGNVDVAVEGVKHLPKTAVIWAVDTVRAVPWIGPEPIAWAEEKAFGLKDSLRRAAYSSGGGGHELAVATQTASIALSDANAVVWPPPRTGSLWKTPEAGEGVWVEPRVQWVKRLSPAAPPAFYQTFVRPDTDRPYVKVLLVAMDTRQLELAMEGGSEDPKPDVGPTGSGHIPRDPAIARRVAAVWNGAFKTEHGHYGMTVNRRVLLPPVPGGASIVTLSDGRLAMGTWGAKPTLGGLAGIADDSIVSMRQNLDPLLEDGVWNPRGRTLWGYTRADNEGMQTHRSGMCITSAGTLIYAWGDDVNASSLGRSMKLAGCVYGMHLDMNPGHTAFMFTNINEIKGKNYKSALLEPDMIKTTERYIEYAQKDFFYVMTRLGDPVGPAAFAPVAELSSEPNWLPAVKKARAGDADLYAFDGTRVGAELELGLGEHVPQTQRAHLLSTIAGPALFRCTLGNTEPKQPMGMAVGSDVLVLPSRADADTATLLSDENGIALAATSTLSPTHRAEFRAELPWLVRGGLAASKADEQIPAAFGRAPGGSWLLLTRENGISSKEAAETLRAYGVSDAVSLGRGRRKHAYCAAEQGAGVRVEDTSLRLVARPAKPRAFAFKALNPLPPPATAKK